MSGYALKRVKRSSGGRRVAPAYRRVGYLRSAAGMRRATPARAVTSRLRVPAGRAIYGKGAYSLSASKDSLQTSAQVPYMHGTATGFRIKHREYISDVLGTIGFNSSQLRINPQAAATFPWLSTCASAFEQYRFHGLCFEFVPTCGDALSASNNALGTVILAANYNAADVPALTKQALMEQMWSRSGKPSVPHLMPVECAKGQVPSTPLYTADVLPAGYDPRLYDMGFLQVATQGMQVAGVNIGELWVTYDIELYKPQTTPLNNASLHIRCNAAAAVTLADLFITNGVVAYNNGITYGIAGNVISLPAGKWQIVISTTSWTFTGADPAVTGGTGLLCMRSNTRYNNLVGYGAQQDAMVFLNITDTIGTVTIPNTASGGTYADLFIRALPANFS